MLGRREGGGEEEEGGLSPWCNPRGGRPQQGQSRRHPRRPDCVIQGGEEVMVSEKEVLEKVG